MDFRCNKILDRIYNLTPEADKFIDEWFDGTPYITAHTSGSTGRPKAVKLLKSDMLASAASTNRYFNITEKSTLLCPLSADYIAGKMMIVRAIASGARLYMEIPGNAPVHYDYGNIDLIAVVPSQVPHLLDDKSILARLNYVLIGGASVPNDLAERIIDSDVNAFVSYGMTETCSHVALQKLDKCNNGVYEAMPDIFFSKNETDCLIVNSTKRSFKKLQTNDIVNLIDERHFIWIGRFDNVINSGGIKVFPEEIEQQLSSVIPDNMEYYIARGNDEKWGEAPVLVISDAVSDTAQLLEVVRNSVKSKAERPVRIIVENIEHTASGKMIRRHFV